MRKLSWLLAALLVVGVAAPAAAQSAGNSFGVTVGFGTAYGTVPKGTERKMEPTFNAGVMALMPMSDNWAFQPEIKFDKRKLTVNAISTDVTYVSVPVLLRNKFLGIYMVQGLALNFVAQADILGVDFKKAANTPDVAIILGVGKRWDKFSLEGRWETGFRSFQKDLDISGQHMRAITAVGTVYLK